MDIERKLKKGFTEYCVLLAIAAGDVYTGDIIDNLKEVDVIVVEGTLYPLLSKLNKKGIVDYYWEESESGPPRKYYSLTDAGLKKLDSYNNAWEKLKNSIQLLT